MLHVFIDANVYLRFYAYADDAIDELEKFKNLIKTNQIRLYVTDQVQFEVNRNKEAEVSRALDKLNKSGQAPEIPRFALHFEKAQELRELYRTCSVLKGELLQEIRDQLGAGQLRADHLIIELFNLAVFVRTTSDHVARAERRRMVGNPPGKRDSLGDQLNWEILLDTVPGHHALHLITADRDFASTLFQGKPSFPLEYEWMSVKAEGLALYSSLKSFAAQHFPHIKLSSDALKFDAISKLSQSTSFADTHYAIASLNDVFEQLTYEDAVLVLSAMIQNPQIHLIADDSDVIDFYKRLYEKYYEKTPQEIDEQLWERANYLAEVALGSFIDEEDLP